MIHDTQAAPMPTFTTRLNAILRNWASPILGSQGFHRAKDVYEKEMGDMAWVVDIQRSRWSDAEEVEFTVNCGVFIRGVTSLYLNRAEPNQIALTDCCVHARVGMLAEDKLDKWWKMQIHDHVTTVDQAIGEELSVRLTQHVIPFLGRFQTPDDGFQFLTNPRAKDDKYIWPQSEAIRFCYAAAIASLLERPREVTVCLEKAVSAAQGSPTEDIVLQVRDRLQGK